MRKPVVMIVIGCCLAANCLGCRYRPRHGLILRGDWSLECNRKPWLTGTNTTHQETSGSAQGCGSGSENGFESYPTPAPMSAGEDQVGYASPSGEGLCGQCGSSLPANLACRTCGHHRQNAAAEVGYYNHPRFHPVPTRPVFSPRTDEAMVAGGQVMPVQAQTPSAQPIPAAPQIRLAPPTPVPEEIRAPRPQPLPTADRVTASPGRTDSVSPSFSWIFNPSTKPIQTATRVAPQSQPRWIRR